MKKRTFDFKIIGFDADDTLWINEPFFVDIENKFCKLLSDFLPKDLISEALFKTEMQNINLYGYGVKGFTLSMIETAIRVCDKDFSNEILNNILDFGKELLNKPVILLDGVLEVLTKLNKKGNKLCLITKGDLLDQRRKLNKSNLEDLFFHIEVMSDKKEQDYINFLSRLGIEPEDFLMVGNSLKSDILPVLKIGGSGIYIPYFNTWKHEMVKKMDINGNYLELNKISDLLEVLN